MRLKGLVYILILSLLVLAPTMYADSTNPSAFRAPSIYKGADTTKIYWTAGTIGNGGHAVSITAGSAALTTTEGDCSAPSFAACNFLYWPGSGATLAVTNTLATAIASGNALMALVETSGGTAVTNIMLPPQSGTMWNQAAGPASTGLTSVTPSGTGSVTVGTAAHPFGSIYLGNAATNNVKLTQLTTSGATTVNLCDTSGTNAFCLADPVDTTKQFVFSTSGLTASKTITFASNSANSRTLTFPDPGGAANIAYVNPTSVQSFSGGVDFNTAVLPHATGMDLGSTSQNFQNVYLHGGGVYGTNYFKITGTSTSGMRTITLPDASITVSGATGTSCGVTNACAGTSASTNLKIVQGITAALDGASPSTAAVTGMPAFTSTITYSCTGTLEGTTAATAAKGVAVTQVSATAVTFYSANGATEKVHYTCIGY